MINPQPQVYILLQFQTIFATGIGFGLALPIILDIFKKNDDHMVQSAKRRLNTLKNQSENIKFLELGKNLNNFRYKRNSEIRKINNSIFISIISAVICFLILIFSSFFGKFEIGIYVASIMVLVAIIPITLGIWHSVRWYLDLRWLRKAISKMTIT